MVYGWEKELPSQHKSCIYTKRDSRASMCNRVSLYEMKNSQIMINFLEKWVILMNSKTIMCQLRQYIVLCRYSKACPRDPPSGPTVSGTLRKVALLDREMLDGPRGVEALKMWLIKGGWALWEVAEEVLLHKRNQTAKMRSRRISGKSSVQFFPCLPPRESVVKARLCNRQYGTCHIQGSQANTDCQYLFPQSSHSLFSSMTSGFCGFLWPVMNFLSISIGISYSPMLITHMNLAELE